MDLPDLIHGRFIRRYNRFRATVSVQGNPAWAHVPNSGRLQELFQPDRPVWLAPITATHRKTSYDLKLVEYASFLVSVDARLPNPLLAEALAKKKLPGFHYPSVEREVTYGQSRLDFCLSSPGQGVCWVETKSVTLVEDGLAQFPDTPTSRGQRHLLELVRARHAGHEAAIVFVVQRPDARRFQPHQEADPQFAAALRLAATAGVIVRAFTCHVSHREITIADEIPVDL